MVFFVAIKHVLLEHSCCYIVNNNVMSKLYWSYR